ncbi:MAG TPA: DUF1585 domain-containing protein, partial [Myxococcota bacterium]|nr:DUF1585 domain-containing protein [Myxococcota bacterium]
MILLLLACPPEPTPPEQEPAVERSLESPADGWLEPLAAPRLLRRMSLDLRGILPSTAELDQVEADPAALAGIRDQYLEDPHLEERLVRLLAERWHSRVDEFLIHYDEYQALGGSTRNEYAFERAVGEEPLRLMAHIVSEDRPWTEVVTSPTTMSNELLGEIWPLDYPEGATGWQEVRYTDGRPAAGGLATNGLWWRYYSTVSNYNRGRAAALTQLLLCEDYLSRPVSFNNQVALVDADGIEEALRSNPYCMGCHSSLDATSSALFGFWVANEYNAAEMQRYHPEREPLGSYLLGKDPGWFGRPLSGLTELGAEIAADPRFARCAAESWAELLWRRELQAGDFNRVEGLRRLYLDNDQRIKPLLRAITDTPVYQAGSLTDQADADTLVVENTTRLIDATLLASVLEDLTGFRWTWQGFEVLDNDTYGFRILGGGVDGSQVTRPQRTPSLTWNLTVQRAAEGAASVA